MREEKNIRDKTSGPCFSFTVFTADSGTRLNKKYELHDGIIKKSAPDNLYKGSYEVYESTDLEEFNTGLNELEDNHALCIGVPNESKKGRIVSRANEENTEDAISRTKDNFKFSDCFIFDIDNSSLQINEVLPALSEIDPELSNANVLVRTSSSYGISEAGELPSSNPHGYHVWVCGIKDPSDIDRYGKAFSHRCWLAGNGHIQLSVTGSMLVRQLVDDSVFSPERLVFESDPTLGEGIIQLDRPHLIQKGNVLNTRLLKSLNKKEQEKYDQLVNKEKSGKNSESEKIKQSYIDQRVREAVSNGTDKSLALQQITASLSSGELYSAHLLYFKNKSKPVTVADVLVDPETFNEETLSDPMEPDYNGSDTVAKFYANSDSLNPLITSFAHGQGKTYKLKNKPNSAKSNFNSTLDAEAKYSHINVQRHLDKNHLLRRMAEEISSVTCIPCSTVLMAGLGVFAAMAARKYTITYPDGAPLPLGLYVVVEQPSGTGKSRCLSYFQKPFFSYQKTRLTELKASMDDANFGLPDTTELIAELQAKLDALTPSLGLTNSTPEGLEMTLSKTNGYFSAASSEQGLFNSLFGSSYLSKGQVSNNDTVLNGFDGGHVSCSRVSREGYVGNVVGGIVSFAQHGCIETLLNAASGTGLSERFLMVAEPHSLGTRTHSQTAKMDALLLDKYQKFCEEIFPALELAHELDELTSANISDRGHVLINEYRNKIEPHLADGGKYSYAALRGAASKANMQIMKISTILQLLGDAPTKPESHPTNRILVGDQYVESAIGIVNELLEASCALCNTKGIIGDKAEFDSILSLFEKSTAPKTERYIIKSKVKTKPFSLCTGNKSAKVRAALNSMVTQKILSRETVNNKTMYSMAQ